MISEDERSWREDRDRNGWTLPFKAAWPLRLPVIRHIRCAWIGSRAEGQAQEWASIGIGLGQISQYDRWVLYAISRGWC